MSGSDSEMLKDILEHMKCPPRLIGEPSANYATRKRLRELARYESERRFREGTIALAKASKAKLQANTGDPETDKKLGELFNEWLA